jgi:hypothetical protein
MKKFFMLATLSMVTMFALSSGGQVPAASAAPTAPEIGTCRWFCGAGGFPYKTESACSAACSSGCDVIC